MWIFQARYSRGRSCHNYSRGVASSSTSGCMSWLGFDGQSNFLFIPLRPRTLVVQSTGGLFSSVPIGTTSDRETTWRLLPSGSFSFFTATRSRSVCICVVLDVPYLATFENVQLVAKSFLVELTSNPIDVSRVPHDLRQWSSS